MAKTIIEIQVSIGDTIYIIPNEDEFKQNIINKCEENNKIQEQKVTSIQWYDNENYFVITENGTYSHSSFDEYITWFINKEQASRKFDKVKATRWDKFGNSKY